MWCRYVPEYIIRMNRWKVIYLFTHNAVCCPVTLSLLFAVYTPNIDRYLLFIFRSLFVPQIMYHDRFFAKFYHHLLILTIWWLIPVATRSKAWVCGRSLAGVVSSYPGWGRMSVSCECCVLSGRGFCVGLIARTEESYWVWCAWVWLWSPVSGGRDPESGQSATGKEKRTIWRYIIKLGLASSNKWTRKRRFGNRIRFFPHVVNWGTPFSAQISLSAWKPPKNPVLYYEWRTVGIYVDVVFFFLAKNANKWQAFVNTVMKLWVFMKDGEYMSSWATVRFSIMTPLHVFSFLVSMINETFSFFFVFLMYTGINVFCVSVITLKTAVANCCL